MLLRRLAAFAVISTLPLALVACGKSSTPDPRTDPPKVRVAFVRIAEPVSRSFTGIVAAKVESELGFRVSGKVQERLVDAGQTVKRGQVLMRIDPVDLKLAAKAQQDMVIAAQARARQTSEEELRYRDLRGTGSISESAYDLVKSAADSAKAQLRATEAQAVVAQNASRYTELLADFNGIVMETLAEPGQVITAGQSVIRLAHDGSREAVIQLPETIRPAIGDKASATLFGNQEAKFPAKLRQLSNTADRLTRTFEARYTLEGLQSNTPLGSTVVIQIPDSKKQKQQPLEIPIGALFDAGKGPGVWVIRDTPEKVYWKPVSVLRINDDSAYVSGEIKPNEKLVALGAHLLQEGEIVRLVDQPSSASNQGESQ